MHLFLPGDAFFEGLPVRRDPLVGGIVDTDLGRQVFFEPVAKFGAEGGMLGTVGEIHGATPAISGERKRFCGIRAQMGLRINPFRELSLFWREPSGPHERFICCFVR